VCQVPVISTQPLPKNICETENTSFKTVVAEAASYRWQVDDGSGFVDINNGTVYSGAFTSNLTLTNVPASFHNNIYRCTMLSGCGATATTTAQSLGVTPAVSITAQPLRDTSCVRSSATITIANAGNAINYKWQMGSPSNGFYDVPNVYPYTGVNSPQLAIAYTEDTLNDMIFRCIVDGSCNTVTSKNIHFTVLSSPAFANSPANTKVKALETATFTATASGANYNMYWQASTDGVNFVNINDNVIYSGTRTKTLKVKNVLPGYDGNTFRCILKSNESACNSVRDTSDIAVLTIDIPTSVTNPELEKDILIYPNPVGDVLRFNTTGVYHHINVYDLNGRLILSQELSSNSISVTALPAGIYAAIFLGNDNKQERHQFIKQ
jgi:hypothetical protein